ncbi:MAG: sugar transferase [Candidatus Binatia bacterium]|nr:sugar transferase [Candidatus Binatia bacterium]
MDPAADEKLVASLRRRTRANNRAVTEAIQAAPAAEIDSADTTALSPIMALIALAVRIDSRGLMLFSQPRVGLNRRRFNAYKFSTMVLDAPALKVPLEHMDEAGGPFFKVENAPPPA